MAEVSWEDVEFIEVAKEMPWEDGVLAITMHNIEVGKNNPHAVFELKFGGNFGGRNKYILGNWYDEED